MLGLLLKRWMPHSLYGRAALILILPVLTLQLVVSVVFIQRHFEGVTAQMTRNVLIETQFLVGQLNAAETAQQAQDVGRGLGGALQIGVTDPIKGAEGDRRRFYDLSGRVVVDVLRGRLPGLMRVDLVTNHRQVRLTVDTVHGPVELRLQRSRVSASNPHQLLVLMIFTGILMTMISFVFLRNQLRPIRRLARAADAFGKGRQVPYHVAGAMEVRQAGAAFLDMRARIERQIEQRTLMLSGISHDLRTPLTRLKLALSMMDETEDTEAMLRDVRDMQRLVDEFLNFARGDALDDAVPTDLTELVRRTIEDTARSGHRIELETAVETGMIDLRPLAVTRALENLLGNAVRYGTCACVRLEQLPGAVRIRVEDDGPGIPEARREDALKPFMRLDPARNQNSTTGVGLGLAIAADIARKHGGRLQLGQSTRLGGLCADLVLAI
jgi:two-component system osmolarity sensor histidine kinase EnvZ